MGRYWQGETEVLVEGGVSVHFFQHKSHTGLRGDKLEINPPEFNTIKGGKVIPTEDSVRLLDWKVD